MQREYGTAPEKREWVPLLYTWSLFIISVTEGTGVDLPEKTKGFTAGQSHLRRKVLSGLNRNVYIAAPYYSDMLSIVLFPWSKEKIIVPEVASLF